MSEFNILYVDTISLEERDRLWEESHVLLDDWDYMLIVPLDQMVVDTVHEWCEPKSDHVAGMLRGGFENTWCIGVFRGRRVGIGVAYHS